MAEDPGLLQGKVASILNEREVAITIGKKHGVRKNMKFAILAPTPEEIRDPETNELLDVVDRPKVLVTAVDVRDRITICSTYRVTTIPGGGFGAYLPIGRLFESDRQVPETLRIDENSQPAPLAPEESYVKIGDRVRQVIEPN